ncbi:MAG: YggS family pyridoxal phosphate-dependent enzyme [Pseudomonadota bacterium]
MVAEEGYNTPSETLEGNLASILKRCESSYTERIDQPRLRSAPPPQLVAVSKTFGPVAIARALETGQAVFGENRVQEAMAKFPHLRERYPDLQLHLIGPLQTNKVKEAVATFDVIETVDRPKLAAALGKEMARTGRQLPCLVQVNTGDEPQKAGISPKSTDAFVSACQSEHGLDVRGLMCIPPVEEEPSLHFALLREIADRLSLPWLSMGMSGDFETAIRFGATHVRVGSAIFGERPKPIG